MSDPLMSRLRRADFLKLAELQDKFVDCIYSFDNALVLHGGTAIWRCYSGNRFSFDIDGYIMSKKESDKINKELTWALSKSGVKLDRVRNMGISIFADAIDQDTRLKLQLTEPDKKIKPIRMNYERADGSFLSVLTLSPEDFIIEKIRAYESRGYIRDLYDIYQLIDKIDDKKTTSKKLKQFIKTIKPPYESELGNIVLSGVVPTFDDIIKHINRALK
jgi:predicted nucleotidyltransferase component of viral defense system